MRHNDYLPTMRRLIALFPQREIGAETIAAYYDLLSDLDGDVFRLAVRQCAETCDWFPTVKQLREAAIDAACRAQGIKAPDEAWAATLAVARGWGEGMSVRARFDDASWVGFRLAELLPLAAVERQELLVLTDPLQRLDALMRLLPRFQQA